jgi:hypothetical protein
MAVDEILTTPFRAHLERCQQLGARAQLVECADYIQHLDVLVLEFLESYYLVERLWDPETTARSHAVEEELVLEPFYESLEFVLGESNTANEPIVCVCGAMSPLPSEQHPALTRHGLDFVGLRAGNPKHIVLGAVQSSERESAFVLLLRALNGLAELCPPLRMAQLGSDILRGGIPEDADFSLCLGVTERADDADARALVELSRDLAERFVADTNEVAQVSGLLSGVSCFELDPATLASGRVEIVWSV